MSNFYHGSMMNSLTKLSPHHGKIFLTPYFDLALFFTARFSDFQISLDIGKDGIPVIHEFVKNALDTIYDQKVGTIYTVDINQELLQTTLWKGECTYEQELTVLRKISYENMLHVIKNEIIAGNIKYIDYNESQRYRTEYLLRKSMQYYLHYGIEALAQLKEFHPDIYRIILKYFY